jgi:UDP-N-acetylmuramate dehydrogenase
MNDENKQLAPPDALSAELVACLGPEQVEANQQLARYTSLRIGGPAELLVVARSQSTLREAITLARAYGVPYRLLGSGSNVLVSDAGLSGLVVLNRATTVTFDRLRVQAESGASFSTVARRSVQRGLAGVEWAANIPGTVGGAVFGNAGAWGGDVASALVEATVLEADGSVDMWPVERFEYAYRSSILKRQAARGNHRGIVLEAVFGLAEGNREDLQAKVADIVARRKASQPPGPTCGSVFKNPPGDHAGRLIEAAGLKGTKVGGAEISSVHANFVVNTGGATAADVKALIELARKSVQEKFGVSLELEIELIGKW